LFSGCCFCRARRRATPVAKRDEFSLTGVSRIVTRQREIYKKNHDVTCNDGRQDCRLSAQMKYWEIIADNLSKAGWSWGCVSAIDSNGRTIWIADAHRGDGKRFVVRADENLTAFVELESVMQDSGTRSQ
jgi:hypothetical protein